MYIVTMSCLVTHYCTPPPPPIGPAFTVVYVIAGLPLARLADTRSRSVVLIVGVGFWSVMVFLTGFVKQFWQLLVLRMFLGIGEVSMNVRWRGLCAVDHKRSGMVQISAL